MRRILGIGAVLLVVCGFSGCGGANKPQDLIVGKWALEGADEKELTRTIEFHQDGTMKIGLKEGSSLQGKYKFIDDRNIEGWIEARGEKKSQKNKIESITSDKMVLVDESGDKAKFTKIK